MKRLVLILLLTGLLLTAVPVGAQDPVVRAVLFYSPTCPHCHKVINEDIPPLSRQYNRQVSWTYAGDAPGSEASEIPPLVGLQGDALQILFVNASTPMGSDLFDRAIELYEIPEPVGVPTLIVGDRYMIGSVDIPDQFPSLISDGLAQGGVEWPSIPGLKDNIARLSPFPEEHTSETEPGSDQERPIQEESTGLEAVIAEEGAESEAAVTLDLEQSELSVRERVLLDPVGNTLSIIVLIGMVLCLTGVSARWATAPRPGSGHELSSILSMLILAGIGVAAYLTFVESTGSEAVCGPVGDCNTVQQSKHAHLFGLIPVGGLGLAGYAGLLIVWGLNRAASASIERRAAIAFFVLALIGTLYSIYLTFLEPFVIGATCMWCLTSAVIMTLLMTLSADPARAALREL